MKTVLLLGLVLPAFLACNSTVNRIFGDDRTPHEKYADHIGSTDAGKEWISNSTVALQQPKTISLPFKKGDKFSSDKSPALALQFKAKQGQRIIFNLPGNGNNNSVYADIFKKTIGEHQHLAAADTTENSVSITVEESGEYILRLQPPLGRKSEYQFEAKIEPSLGFPVAGKKARIGSVWGDARDGGRRSHEGIDIFAAKRTPVVAVADGYITRVNNGGLGGKTVSMRPTGLNLSLYYAHLDEQWVKPGQKVSVGDTLGLVGNTGNARTTPPHLHFGIYTTGGAVDPLPFVKKSGEI